MNSLRWKKESNDHITEGAKIFRRDDGRWQLVTFSGRTWTYDTLEIAKSYAKTALDAENLY